MLWMTRAWVPIKSDTKMNQDWLIEIFDTGSSSVVRPILRFPDRGLISLVVGGAMVNMLALIMVDRRFKPRLGQTIDY